MATSEQRTETVLTRRTNTSITDSRPNKYSTTVAHNSHCIVKDSVKEKRTKHEDNILTICWKDEDDDRWMKLAFDVTWKSATLTATVTF